MSDNTVHVITDVPETPKKKFHLPKKTLTKVGLAAAALAASAAVYVKVRNAEENSFEEVSDDNETTDLLSDLDSQQSA
jgi:hypothetical protein